MPLFSKTAQDTLETLAQKFFQVGPEYIEKVWFQQTYLSAKFHRHVKFSSHLTTNPIIHELYAIYWHWY